MTEKLTLKKVKLTQTVVTNKNFYLLTLSKGLAKAEASLITGYN